LPRVLLALSTGQKLGLVAIAAVFIGFALASSFLFPRRDPDYPTERWLRWFVVACIALFVAMMSGMLLLAREEEGEAAGGHGAETTETEATETETETEPTETEGPAPTGEEPAAGDAEAGAGVFEEAGCGGCHTLEAAGSSGTIGPNLDDSQPELALVVDRVTNGAGAMPAFGDRLSEEEISNVAAYVVESTGGG
jgi:mono/diheme cytochrome c family protein